MTPFGSFGNYQNFLKYSEDFGSSVWTPGASTTVQLNQNTYNAPDGTTTADKIVASGASAAANNILQDYAYGSSINGKTFTGSVWLKAASNMTINLRITDNADANGGSSSITVTNRWQRFSITQAITGGVATSARFQIGYTASTFTIWAWGAQLEEASAMSNYAATSGAAASTAGKGLLAEGTGAHRFSFGQGVPIISFGDSANTSLVSIRASGGSVNSQLFLQSDTSGYIGLGNNAVNTSLNIYNSSNAIAVLLDANSANNSYINAGNLGIGTTSPAAGYKLDVNGKVNIVGDGTTNAFLTVGSGTGKIDVGTIDPPYTINGEKYATYLPSMTGVKEETTGFITTDELMPGIGYRKIIDFNNLQKGSDLWLFSKVTDLANNLDQMVVLLTPTDNTRSWYKIDKNLNQLVIYSARPTSIAYRLTAPRFDSENFQNTRDSDTVGFIINSPDNKVTLDQNGYLPQETLGGISGYDILVSSESASLSTENGNIYQLRTKSGDIIYDFASYSQAIIANIKAGIVDGAQGIFETIVANSAVIKNLKVENLTVGNISQLGNSQILSPVGDLTATGTASLSRLKTDSIAPLSDQGKIEFDLSQNSGASTSGGSISVKGKDGLEVASIDSAGNSIFAGTLRSDQAVFNEASVAGIITSDETQTGKLSAGEATISGELSVNNLKVNGAIQSDQINNLQSSFGDLLGRVATLENQNNTASITEAPTPTVAPSPAPTIDLSIPISSESSILSASTSSAAISSNSATLLDALAGFLTSSSKLNQNVEQFIATSTALINSTSIPNPDNNVVLTNNIALAQPTDTHSQNQVRTLSDLKVYGQSSLADTIISGQLIVDGGIVIENNKVAALDNTLYLSSLNSVDILGGRMVVDKFGNLDVAGQIIAREGIVTDQITPLGKDLSINLSKGNTTAQDSFGKLIIKGASEEPAASFDVLGNATISGELSLNKLNLNYKEASPPSTSGLLSAIENLSLHGINAPSADSQGTTGQNIIPAGSQQLVIYNSNITEHTLIYITPASPTANKVIFVADKKLGSYFTVALDSPIPYDVKFNWWIIN